MKEGWTPKSGWDGACAGWWADAFSSGGGKGWRVGRAGGGPVALKEHVVRTKGAEIRKLPVKVREPLDTFALGSTDI